MIKLFITDLDDTLYSWIGFFIPAFYAMADELSHILHKDRDELLAEYRIVHQKRGSTEFPFATLELPSVKEKFSHESSEEVQRILDPVFHKFNSTRKKYLHLYPGVKETLEQISAMGIKVVGYTESSEENGFYRLKKLGIDNFFHKVYVSDSQYKSSYLQPSSKKTVIVRGKKPNVEILKQICAYENICAHEGIYIGDSLTKDIYMGKQAHMTSILFKYPCDEQKATMLYQRLIPISHWTTEDFEREASIREECQLNNICPDYTISSFQHVLSIIQKLDQKENEF